MLAARALRCEHRSQEAHGSRILVGGRLLGVRETRAASISISASVSSDFVPLRVQPQSRAVGGERQIAAGGVAREQLAGGGVLLLVDEHQDVRVIDPSIGGVGGFQLLVAQPGAAELASGLIAAAEIKQRFEARGISIRRARTPRGTYFLRSAAADGFGQRRTARCRRRRAGVNRRIEALHHLVPRSGGRPARCASDRDSPSYRPSCRSGPCISASNPSAAAWAGKHIAELPVEVEIRHFKQRFRRAIGILGLEREALAAQMHVRDHAQQQRVFQDGLLDLNGEARIAGGDLERLASLTHWPRDHLRHRLGIGKADSDHAAVGLSTPLGV